MTAQSLTQLEYKIQFLPAKPWSWVIRLFQQYIRLELWLNNRLQIEPADLATLKNLPRDAGVILTANHADETDFKICVELSRLSGRRFFYLMNAEAFGEGFGMAGWWLQRLGAFSVDRGGDTASAKRFAMDTLKEKNSVLIVFPEGEIYYLNDKVQPFKTGAVEIGMQALLEKQQTYPDWKAYLLPMSIRYRYTVPLGDVMDKKIREIEKRLDRRVRYYNLQMRLSLILAELLHREEIEHKLKPGSASLDKLSERLQEARDAILKQLEDKYDAVEIKPKTSTIDRIWQLSAYIRSRLKQKWRFDAAGRRQFVEDLSDLKRLAQMCSWQPDYVDVLSSQERLAESIIKLERDVFKINRPKPLAQRSVFVRIGKAIDLSEFLPDYLKTPHLVRHSIAEQLRQSIQILLDTDKNASSKRPLPQNPA